MMKKFCGIRLRKKLVKIWRRDRCFFRLKKNSVNLVSRFIDWSKRATHKLSRIRRGRSDYHRIRDFGDEQRRKLLKGHLSVYVGGYGDEWDPPRRYLVPVIYFNHPLFGELLKEAEAEFGFDQQGGITIPCPVSKFEWVWTRIASEPVRKGCGFRI